MSTLDLSEACLSRVWAFLSWVQACLSWVRACLSGVRACLSGVQKNMKTLITLLFLSLELWGKKYVTTTYSAYKSAKNVFKGTLPLRWLARVLIVHPRQILLVGVVSQGSYCIPQLNPVSWGGQPGPIVYHSWNHGTLGWLARGQKSRIKKKETKNA